MANRQTYFDASPVSYATYANNGIGVLLATGTNDDLVDPKTQTEAFQLALKQAGFFVRPCIVPGAPHYWMNDPIEEPGGQQRMAAHREEMAVRSEGSQAHHVLPDADHPPLQLVAGPIDRPGGRGGERGRIGGGTRPRPGERTVGRVGHRR